MSSSTIGGICKGDEAQTGGVCGENVTPPTDSDDKNDKIFNLIVFEAFNVVGILSFVKYSSVACSNLSSCFSKLYSFQSSSMDKVLNNQN